MSVTVRSQDMFSCVAEEFPRSIDVSAVEVAVVATVVVVVVDDQVVVAWSRSLLLVLWVCARSEDCIVDAPVTVFSGRCPVVEVGVAVRGNSVGRDMPDSCRR